MIAYKGFEPGLVCRGYQFQMGLNQTDFADVHARGFHCAKNPLDCLTYYHDMEMAEYCLVDAGGDRDEGMDQDTQIACTQLTIIKRLTKQEFFLHGLLYMRNHPTHRWGRCVRADRGLARRGYAVVRGLDPMACGEKVGDVLAMAVENLNGSTIVKLSLAVVDGEQIKPGLWYNAALEERQGVAII